MDFKTFGNIGSPTLLPLVLGSPISFIIMLWYIPVIAKRIRNEEEVLTAGLHGYKLPLDRNN